MRPAVMRKLREALSRTSFCIQRKRPQATSTMAAPVPIGAAYSPSTSDRALMLMRPPLRRVSEMVLDVATPEASQSGILAYGAG